MHRRDAREDGDLLQRDVLRHSGRIEARVQDELGSQAQAENQDDRKRVDVEQRQDAQNALFAFPQRGRLAARQHFHVLRAGRGQIGVGQHRALGRAGRAAGVLDDRDRLGRIAEGMGLIAPVVVEEVAERDAALVVPDFRQHALRRHERLHRTRRERVFGEFADDEPLQPRRGEKLLRLRVERGEVEGDEDVRLAVLDLEFERPQRVERRIVDDRPTGLQHAEKGDHVMGGVRQIEADMHAGPDAELLEARRGAIGEPLEFRIRDPLVHELKRRERAELRAVVSRMLWNGRDVDRRVPADAGGIGLQPRLSVHRLPRVSSSLFLRLRADSERRHGGAPDGAAGGGAVKPSRRGRRGRPLRSRAARCRISAGHNACRED